MENTILLPSTSGAGAREAALIYYPGALVDPKHYVNLCGVIQTKLQEAGVAMHVAIPPCPPFTAAMFTPEGQITAGTSMLHAALDALLTNCGFKGSPDQVFLAGHSHGGVLASAAAFAGHDPDAAAAPPCRSIAMHGAYITPSFNTRHALTAVPVAEILGRRDGLIRLNNIAMHHVALEENIPDAVDRARIAPVAILPGASHTSFSDGASTVYVAPKDLPPTQAVAAATDDIAAATARFILATYPYADKGAAASAAAALAESTQHADRAYFDVYRDALARDKTGATCRTLQQLLLGLVPFMELPGSACCPEGEGFGDGAVTVKQPHALTALPPASGDGDEATEALGTAEFAECEAELLCREGTSGSEGGAAGVEVVPVSCVSMRGPDTPPLTSQPWAPTGLRLKLRSRRCVAAALAAAGGGRGGQTTAHEETERLDPFTVARMNEHVVRSVLSTLPEEVRELYQRSPRRLAFGPDVCLATAEEWRAAELSFVDLLEVPGEGGGWQPGEEEGRVVLQSPCVVGPPGDGAVCCTVISEAQAFEYIMYESQKGPGVEVDGEGVLARGRVPPAAAQ